MIVLGISYHISLPMETLPIVNKDHIKTRLVGGIRVKNDDSRFGAIFE